MPRILMNALPAPADPPRIWREKNVKNRGKNMHVPHHIFSTAESILDFSSMEGATLMTAITLSFI